MNILGSPTDQDILGIEPMLSSFYARRLENATRSQMRSWKVAILKDLLRSPKARKIAEKWIAAAFKEAPGQPSTKRNHHKARSGCHQNFQKLIVFIEYFWLVFQKQEKEAVEYLKLEWRRHLISLTLHSVRPKSSRKRSSPRRLPVTAVARSNTKRVDPSTRKARPKAKQRTPTIGQDTSMPRNPPFSVWKLKFKKIPKAGKQDCAEDPITPSVNYPTENQARSSSPNDNLPPAPPALSVLPWTPRVVSSTNEILSASDATNVANRIESARNEGRDCPLQPSRYPIKRKIDNAIETIPVTVQDSTGNNQFPGYSLPQPSPLSKRPRTIPEGPHGSKNVIENWRPVDNGPGEYERAHYQPASEFRGYYGTQSSQNNVVRVGAFVDTLCMDSEPLLQGFEEWPAIMDVEKSVLRENARAQSPDYIRNGFQYPPANVDQQERIDPSIPGSYLHYHHPTLLPGPDYAAFVHSSLNPLPSPPNQRAEITEFSSINLPSTTTAEEVQHYVENPGQSLSHASLLNLTGPAFPGCIYNRAESFLIQNSLSQHTKIRSDQESQNGPNGSFGICIAGHTKQAARSKARPGHSSLAHPISIDRPLKNPLPRMPPIWAQSRQELCESFDWFRSYHSGVYFSGGYVKGYLLSAFSASRDIFRYDGRLIISHGGGKSECLQVMDGERVILEATDQSAQDHSVNSLLATYQNCRPIVLLIDDKYALFPYDLAKKEVTYAVLGFYVITHAWAEYQRANDGEAQVVRYKFAFQWCERQGIPWWLSPEGLNENGNTAPTSEANSSTSDRSIPSKASELSTTERRPLQPENVYAKCGSCGARSPHVYQQGWVCLKPKCTAFWKTEDGALLPDQLEYTDRFLTLLPSPANDDALPELQPIAPNSSSQYDTSRFRWFCRGWHCRACGRLSCRYQWECLECSSCKKRYGINPGVLEAKTLNRRPKVKFYQHLISPKSGIRFSPVRSYNYGGGFGEFQTYTLPHNRGYIHHIRGKAVANSEANGIFKEYQQHAINGNLLFRRWPLRSHKTRGTLLANYFSQNSGQPYQYVGAAGHTVPLEHTSSAVRHALQLIQDRIRQALHKETNFNEVLTAAYMQRQKMAFHSDDEKGLGPMVAGLSLGSPALMHFRLNPKYATKGVDGGIDITFLLCHGDVLVMDGAGVQDFYQHTVIPYDFRIAATARCIDPKIIGYLDSVVINVRKSG